jgi:cob(I)alamin adenosyltransferase
MRYYTKKGDEGQTQGLNGRCTKSDPQIEALGALDEAQVALGFAAVHAQECVHQGAITSAKRRSPSFTTCRQIFRLRIFATRNCSAQEDSGESRVTGQGGSGRDGATDKEIYETLRWMQRTLFAVGGTKCPKSLTELLTETEKLCDSFTPDEPQTAFVLPGSSELSARIDLARVAIRRYERKLCAISEQNNRVRDILPLVNRFSDLCYALAQYAADF